MLPVILSRARSSLERVAKSWSDFVFVVKPFVTIGERSVQFAFASAFATLLAFVPSYSTSFSFVRNVRRSIVPCGRTLGTQHIVVYVSGEQTVTANLISPLRDFVPLPAAFCICDCTRAQPLGGDQALFTNPRSFQIPSRSA